MVEAERQLMRIEAHSIGAGNRKPEVLAKAIRRLERTAGVARGGKKARTLGDWAAAGVPVHVERKEVTDG